MSCLPSLDADTRRHLPLFMFTGQRLVTVLLLEPREDQYRQLADIIADDPVLASWIAIRAEVMGSSPLTSVDEAAHWLSEHWMAEFLEMSAESPPVVGDSGDREGWQRRLRQSVLAARWSRDQFAVPPGEEGRSSEQQQLVYWLTLLQDTPAWFHDCFPGEDMACGIPGWIASLPAEMDLTAVMQQSTAWAQQQLEAVESSEREGVAEECPGAHLHHVLQWIQLEHSGWLAEQGWLPRLARLAGLEHQFMETLEREKLASLKELAYGASHEINNPLANISSRAQTLLRDESDPERQRMLATINSQAFRAHEMISDMMLFAKPPKMDLQSVDLVGLVQDVLGEMKDDAEQQGTELRCEPTAGPVVIPVDQVQLAEAVKALCRNGLESLGAGGSVSICVELADCPQVLHPGHAVSALREAVITVRDNGPGISEQVRNHLFDPFFSGREAGRGLGFGLSKCWRIVTEHGGQVEVHSSAAEGTTFTLRFPGEVMDGEQQLSSSPPAEAG